MIEQQGNMFFEYLDPGVVYVITTNGYVRNDGAAVMGRGTAKVAATLNPSLPRILGDLLLAYGNRPYVLPGNFVTLPVKHNWDEKADVDLINESLKGLGYLYSLYDWTTRQMYLPRPGCGNGQLSWHQVEPLVKEWFDFSNVTVWSL